MAALLAFDGNEVIRAIPATLLAVGGIVGSAAALVAAYNSRQAKKELRPNGGGSAYDQITARLDSQDDDMADLKTAVADIARTVGFVMHEMAAEKVRAQYAEAELSARIDNEHERHT